MNNTVTMFALVSLHRALRKLVLINGITIGPRELVIFDPAALIPVLGSGSITGKGPFYDSLETSVSTTRDKEFHRKRRKIWDNAFKKCEQFQLI